MNEIQYHDHAEASAQAEYVSNLERERDEMLEALRACEAALYGLGNDHRIDSAWAKARAAIAKAEGAA
jgi:hypothetical protein